MKIYIFRKLLAFKTFLLLVDWKLKGSFWIITLLHIWKLEVQIRKQYFIVVVYRHYSTTWHGLMDQICSACLPSSKYPSKLLSVKSTVVPKLFSCNTFAKCMQLMMYLPHRRKMWKSLTTVTENGALQIISFTLATKKERFQVTTCGWMANLFYQMQSARTKKVSLSINILKIKNTEIMGPTLQSK